MGTRGHVNTKLNGHKLLAVEREHGAWWYVCECDPDGNHGEWSRTYEGARDLHRLHKEAVKRLKPKVERSRSGRVICSDCARWPRSWEEVAAGFCLTHLLRRFYPEAA